MTPLLLYGARGRRARIAVRRGVLIVLGPLRLRGDLMGNMVTNTQRRLFYDTW